MRALPILLFLTLSEVSLAETSTRTEHYPIFGTTGIALLNEMSAKGPQGYSGYTSHEYNYNYRTRMINGRCRLSQMSINLDITYTMPRWENQSSADAALQDRWEAWYSVLEQHEQGHGAFTRAGYDDILSEWRRIGTSENCQDIRSQVEQIYNTVRARVNQQNIEYDQVTNHGQSQGLSYQLLAGDDAVVGDSTFASGDGNYWWLLFAGLIGLLVYVRKS